MGSDACGGKHAAEAFVTVSGEQIMAVFVKRVYEAPAPEDGVRILVDRLWPRGVSKDKGKIDRWIKDVAPSNELRKWYNHEPDKWPEFKSRYFAELTEKHGLIDEIANQVQKGDVTLVYSSKETRYNNAVALAQYILSQIG